MRATSLQADEAALGVGLEDHVRELLGVGEPAQRVIVYWKTCPSGHRRLADLPGGDLDVLLLDGVRRRRRPSGCATAIFSGSSQTRML